MNRRSFLRSITALPLATAAAGCVSSLDPDSSGSSIGDRDATPHTDGTRTWPGYGFDPANTWHNPDVTLLEEPPEAGRITRNGSGLATSPDSAIGVVGNRLFFGRADGLLVSYATTGEREWEHVTDRRGGVYSTPALTREVVFVTTENGTTALSAPSGGRLWTSDAYVRSGGTVLADDRIYARTDDAFLVALEVETGDPVWSLDSEVVRGEEGKEEFPNSSATAEAMGVDDGVVYATGSWDGDGNVFAVEDGEALWWRPGFEPITRPPAVAGDLVVVSTGERILALDRDDGEVVWEYRHPSTWSSAHGRTPAIAHGHVYVGGPKTTCLDLESGERLWSVETGGRREPPIAVEDGLYVGTLEGLFAFEPDGTLRFHHEEIRTERPVTAVGDRLYAVVSSGVLGSNDVYELTVG